MSQHGQGLLPIHSAAVLRGGRSLSRPRFSPDGSWLAFLTESKVRRELALLSTKRATTEVWLPLDPSAGREFAWCPSDGLDVKNGRIARRGSHLRHARDAPLLSDAFSSSDLLYLSSDGRLCLANNGWCSAPLYAAVDASGLAVAQDGERLALVVDLRELHVWRREGEGFALEWRGTLGADFIMGPSWCGATSLFLLAWDNPHMAWQKSRILRWGFESGPETVLEEDDTAYSTPIVSPNQLFVAFLSDRTGWRNLWFAPSGDWSKRRCVLKEEREHGGIAWPGLDAPIAWFADSSRVALCRNVNARGELIEVDIASGEIEVQGQGVYRSITAHSEVAGVVSSAAISGILHHSSMGVMAQGPLLGVSDGIEPEDVEWRSTGGATVFGRLYRTPNRPRDEVPLLVHVHGGPNMQSPVSFNPDWTYFLARGWNVLVVDYRGSTGRGRVYQQSLNGHWGVMDVDDVLAGVTEAVKQGWGNPGGIVLAGGSSAGVTILNALAREKHGVAGAVVEYPVCDALGLLDVTWRVERYYLNSLIGDPDLDRQLFVDRSPISLAGRISVPLLVLHGDADESVPLSQSEEFVARVREKNDQVDFHVYPGEVHGWRSYETKVDVLERTFDFASRVVGKLSDSERRVSADEGTK